MSSGNDSIILLGVKMTGVGSRAALTGRSASPVVVSLSAVADRQDAAPYADDAVSLRPFGRVTSKRIYYGCIVGGEAVGVRRIVVVLTTGRVDVVLVLIASVRRRHPPVRRGLQLHPFNISFHPGCKQLLNFDHTFYPQLQTAWPEVMRIVCQMDLRQQIE